MNSTQLLTVRERPMCVAALLLLSLDKVGILGYTSEHKKAQMLSPIEKKREVLSSQIRQGEDAF